jgi:hypothetical protein
MQGRGPLGGGPVESSKALGEDEAAGMLNVYLDAQRKRAEEAARAAGGAHGERLTGARAGAQEPTEH